MFYKKKYSVRRFLSFKLNFLKTTVTGTKWTWGSPQHQVPTIKGFLKRSGACYRCRRQCPIPKTFPFASCQVHGTSNFAVMFSSSWDPCDLQARTLFLLDSLEGACVSKRTVSDHQTAAEALPTQCGPLSYWKVYVWLTKQSKK